jgi:hypothetical protein
MPRRPRRGIFITNTGQDPVTVSMAARDVRVDPGRNVQITATEVRDPAMRDALQLRAISIVRPATEEEEQALRARLSDASDEDARSGEEDASR